MAHDSRTKLVISPQIGCTYVGNWEERMFLKETVLSSGEQYHLASWFERKYWLVVSESKVNNLGWLFLLSDSWLMMWSPLAPCKYRNLFLSAFPTDQGMTPFSHDSITGAGPPSSPAPEVELHKGSYREFQADSQTACLEQRKSNWQPCCKSLAVAPNSLAVMYYTSTRSHAELIKLPPNFQFALEMDVVSGIWLVSPDRCRDLRTGQPHHSHPKSTNLAAAVCKLLAPI